MHALSNNFTSWIEVSTEEFEFLCQKEAKRNLHARLSGIVEPLLQKVPPKFLLPFPEVTSLPSLEHITLVTYEMTLKCGSVSRVKQTMIYEKIIMETLEDLKADNFMVRERLSNREEMFKRQDGKTTSIEGMLGAILSRFPPPP